MNRADIQRGVDATVEPLSEITRAAVWQRIEDEIVKPQPRPRWFPVAMFAAGAALATAIAIVLRGGSPAERTVLVVPSGEYHRAFAGGDLTVYGPGEVELDPTLDRPALRIHSGTVIVRRAPVLAALEVTTPESSRIVRDTVVGLRVTEQSTEIASGEQSVRALIERRVHELAAPPTPSGTSHDTASNTSNASGASPGTASAASGASLDAASNTPSASSSSHDTASNTSNASAAHDAASTTHAPGKTTSNPTDDEAWAAAYVPHDTTSAARTAGTTSDTASTTANAPGTASITSNTDAQPAADAGVTAPTETLADRYARAERSIADGNLDAARDLLTAIAHEDPNGRLGAAASYDLALIASRQGKPDTALQHLERVLGSKGEPSLHAPAERLRCRIQAAKGKPCPTRGMHP